MTVIYLAEHNFKCYGVTLENNGCVRVQKFKDISINENSILYKTASNVCRKKSCL